MRKYLTTVDYLWIVASVLFLTFESQLQPHLNSVVDKVLFWLSVGTIVSTPIKVMVVRYAMARNDAMSKALVDGIMLNVWKMKFARQPKALPAPKQ